MVKEECETNGGGGISLTEFINPQEDAPLRENSETIGSLKLKPPRRNKS
jgi:hypothetical protein